MPRQPGIALHSKKESGRTEKRWEWGRKRRKEGENTCRCGDTLGAGVFPAFLSAIERMVNNLSCAKGGEGHALHESHEERNSSV